MRDFLALFPRAIKATIDDGCIGHAKGAAYSALLSFFPLMAVTATLLLEARADWVTQNLYDFLTQVLPPGTDDLVFEYFAVRGQRPVLLPITAVLVSIFGASGVTTSLMQGFDAAYRIPTGRHWLRERIIAIALVFLAALPLLCASALVLLGATIERHVGYWLGLLPQGAELRGWVSIFSMLARYIVALGSICMGTAILYYFAPNRPQNWRRVWPGAIAATVLWFGTTLVFGWYVSHIAHYNVMYGSIAAVVLLLVWMYVLALIAFIGCEFNAVYERASGASNAH